MNLLERDVTRIYQDLIKDIDWYTTEAKVDNDEGELLTLWVENNFGGSTAINFDTSLTVGDFIDSLHEYGYAMMEGNI